VALRVTHPIGQRSGPPLVAGFQQNPLHHGKVVGMDAGEGRLFQIGLRFTPQKLTDRRRYEERRPVLAVPDDHVGRFFGHEAVGGLAVLDRALRGNLGRHLADHAKDGANPAGFIALHVAVGVKRAFGLVRVPRTRPVLERSAFADGLADSRWNKRAIIRMNSFDQELAAR
jgi:hypothetical protein